MWMLGCLEIVEYSFEEVYYDMFIPGILPTFAPGIISTFAR